MFSTAYKRFLGHLLLPIISRTASRRLIGGRQGLILTFHYIGAPVLPGVSEDLFLSREEFSAVLDFVSTELCPLPPAEFLSRLRSGTLPAAATLLTLDDCLGETVDIALLEFQKRNLTGCFFANPGLIDANRTVPSLHLMDLCARSPKGRFELPLNPSMALQLDDDRSRAAAFRKLWPLLAACPSRQQPELLSSIQHCMNVAAGLPAALRLAGWDDLALLHAAGMPVANHTPFHSTVNADGIELFTSDVELGYAVMEEHFPAPARIFCYPYGRKIDATPQTTARLRDLGTDFAFVTQGGIAKVDGYGTLNLRREEASYSAGATQLSPVLALLR